MRICVLSDCVFATPTPDGHGLGLVTWQVAEGLRANGHDVTLIAKEGSQFSGTLHTVKGAKLYEGEILLAKDAMRLHRVYPFDVFLDNGHLHIIADMFPDVPVVNVYHDVYQPYQRCPILLSEGQRAAMPAEFENARVIHNALNPRPFNPSFDTYEKPFALFMGALSEIKQPLLAIEACARLGIDLVLAGSEVIGRFPSGAFENVQVVGSVKGAQKHALLRNARVFLQLGTNESFGLTTLEANLSGTPVVAWATGGSVDIIQDGVNGAFVPMGGNAVQAVADTIQRAWDMPRERVYAHALTFANVNKQVSEYEDALADCMQGVWW